MAFVITEPCVGLLDTRCQDACPVDCIHPHAGDPGARRATMLYIDPVTCIDCSACMEVCPVDAPMLEADVPEAWDDYVAINAAYFGEGGLDAAEALLTRHLSAGPGATPSAPA
jgi:ferredoxin